MWRRSESDFVHSQRRVQASWREICTCMAVPLPQRSGPAPPPLVPPHEVRPGQDAGPAPDGPQTPATLKARRVQATAAGPIPMEKFLIEGGVPLSGTIVPAGNKNGALPILAACLLTDDEVILRNVPRISDVETMVLLLQTLGARVEWLGPSEVLIDSSTVERGDVDRGLAERIRGSFLLAGPLLARFGRARMPPPGRGLI